MARRVLNRSNVNEVLDAHLDEIQGMLSKLKSTEGKTPEQIAEDQTLYNVMVDAGDLARASSLGEFYTFENRATDGVQAKIDKAIADSSNDTIIPIDDIDYVVEDLLRNPTQDLTAIPAEVLRRKQQLYPQQITAKKIPQATGVSDASMLSLGMNVLTDRQISRDSMNPPEAHSLSFEKRQMNPRLAEALQRQGLLAGHSDLSKLRTAGMHGDYKGRAEEGSFETIQSALIGDMVANRNPVTGAPLGPAFIENGKLVRDTIEGGHVRSRKAYPDLRHKPNNIVAELFTENHSKSSADKDGPGFTHEQALFNTVDTLIKKNENPTASLLRFKDNMLDIAQVQPDLESKILNLLQQVEVVENMTQTERNRRRYRENANWSNLM